jgi:rhodanese-related sulfurtransferase
MAFQLERPDPATATEYFKDKMSFTTGPVEAERRIREHDDVVVLDVREKEDFDQGHIPGAKNLPKEEWNTASSLDKDKLYLIYCYSHVCHLAAEAAHNLASRGFAVMEIDGGFEEWKNNELPVEEGETVSSSTEKLHEGS